MKNTQVIMRSGEVVEYDTHGYVISDSFRDFNEAHRLAVNLTKETGFYHWSDLDELQNEIVVVRTKYRTQDEWIANSFGKEAA